MSSVQIPNLPNATALSGNEQLEIVQAGASYKTTPYQLGQYINAFFPTGIVTVNGSLPIVTTTIYGVVNVGIQPASIGNGFLAPMNAGTVKANLTGSSATPSDVTPSAILDTFGSATGDILYRSSGGWAALAPGSSGQFLTSNGSAAPTWTTSPYIGTVTSITAGTGLSGGTITTSGTIALANTTVAAGSYGSATNSVTVTVNAQGQITAASNAPISIAASQITSGTLTVAQGGTGVTTSTGTGSVVLSNSPVLVTPNLGTPSAINLTNATGVPAGQLSGTVPIANGGTNATTAAAARSNLGAAASGANSDITSLSGLTTPLSESQGGTGTTTFLAALTAAANALPTTLPASAGVLWNNGGTISIS